MDQHIHLLILVISQVEQQLMPVSILPEEEQGKPLSDPFRRPDISEDSLGRFINLRSDGLIRIVLIFVVEDFHIQPTFR